ncbi:MAG: CDP-diacylglycerol--serine O-phosphatidyltransferase [Dethiobacter sp.]|nr:MAG: CDP-diacylglycerol--serine O-phosphatidyltransferase [Dethiobacter sp.]
MSFKEPARKNIPNIFTMSNLILGMLALFYVLDGRNELSISLVFIAMVLDGLDGKIAVMLKACSELGKQLDSLCDLVSFGVVPAVIIYKTYLYQFGLVGMLFAMLFPLAGAYRLARFNLASPSNSWFMGLPITIAGGALAALSLHSNPSLAWVVPLYTFILAFLMISKIQYPAIKKGQREVSLFTFILFYSGILSFIFFVIFMREAVLYLLMSYIVFGILNKLYLKLKSGKVVVALVGKFVNKSARSEG